MTGLYARFSEAAARFGGRIAVEVQRRDGVESWTYERLEAAAEATASFLATRGVRRGDRCALLAENDADWCAAYLGMLQLGAVAVPLDTTYTSRQIARLVADCGARVILTSPRLREKVERAQAQLAAPCPSFPVHRESVPGQAGDVAACPEAAVEPDQAAVILYTSGTTSDPKGVVLTHGNLLAEIDATLHVVSISENDAILGVLPLFHALALLANLLLPLSVGARVVFLETLNTGDLLRALHEREISAFCCVPQFFYLIHQRVLEQVARGSRLRRLAFHLLLGAAGILRERCGINLGPMVFRRIHRALGPRMRLLVTGGSRFDPHIGRDLYRLGFNILQAYGLTETSGASTILRPNDRRVDSVGQALPGVELKIVPGEPGHDTGNDPVRSTRQVGEVAIRGPIVSLGYFGRADANAVAFRDGWLHTGDLGYLDEAGRLFITGRAKDVIVLGSGKNIYPEEIEAHYARSPYIKELCVIGRARPDAPASERLHGIIVPDFDVLRERKMPNSREILRFEIENLSTQVPGHKRIMSYDVVAHELPRTTTRKLKRFEIERELGQARHTEPGEGSRKSPPDLVAEAAWSADPQVSRVVDFLRDAAEDPSSIRPSANLELDLGLDSMERVELLAALEARFGVSVPEEVAQRIQTVGELVDAVRSDGSSVGHDTNADFDPWQGLLLDIADDDSAVAPILVARPVLARLVFVGARFVYALAWLLLGLRVSGREHLPERGPFLVSPNHQSFLDAFLLAGALPWSVFRNVFYVGASEYFATPFWTWIARLIHVVPVDPDSNLVRAMRAGAHGLRSGKVLILFPEGERSIDAEIKTFKKGAAILSFNTGAPIVPVALDGIFDIWPRAGWPRLLKLLPLSGARTQVRFGRPIEPARRTRHTDEEYASLTEQLRRAVGEMLDDLRGEPSGSTAQRSSTVAGSAPPGGRSEPPR